MALVKSMVDAYGHTPGQLGAMKEGRMTATSTDAITKETWQGCYDHGWQEGDLVADAFSHPAKMARGLVYRIVSEGLRRGWWAKDPATCIIDPFGGIGSTGLACSASGLASLSIELEQKFVDLANANFDLHRAHWRLLGLPEPRIIQGDSRRLREIVAEAIGGSVTSPPYEGIAQTGGTRGLKEHNTGLTQGERSFTEYGTTPGQLGAMKEGITPEAENLTDPANIARLPIGSVTSPPYGNRVDDHGVDQPGHEGESEKLGRYGESDGQLGNLRISGVTSPPYEGTATGKPSTGNQRGAQKNGHLSEPGDTYGTSPGQIANSEGDTYWSAVATIYQQLYDLFPPGGHLACVVKSFVRNKQIVDLPQMTLDLLRSQGWVDVLWVDAALTSEGVQESAFPELVPQYQKERKSFFRRLAERKGSPRIDAEVVLVVRK